MKIKKRSLYFVARNELMVGSFMQYIHRTGKMLNFLVMPDPVSITSIHEDEFEVDLSNGVYDYVKRINRDAIKVCTAEYDRIKEIEDGKYK